MVKKDEKQISLTKAFTNVFGKGNNYFGEWYLSIDRDLINFLENIKEDKKPLIIQIQSLYLYLESLEILKKESKKKISLNNFMSRDTWYCCVLLLLIGLIDQNTKTEYKKDNKTTKCLKDRFQLVMNYLSNNEKQYMLNHYRGHNKFKKFEEISADLYSTRNFFAHEIIVPTDSIPQDTGLALDKERDDLFHLNMPHGQIFLKIIVAFIKYKGYKGEINLLSDESFESITDMLRNT